VKWRDVNYLCHGLEAEVIHDDGPPDCPFVCSHHGTISCSPDGEPSLRIAGGDIKFFHDAIVLLVPPRRKR